MAGWENDNVEPHVEQVELLVDTNPDLYKQRTIAALSERQYRDAMNEAQTALKYGNNALEYHVLIARVLFEWGEYSVCMQYIMRHLWTQKEDSNLLPEEQNYIYYVYAACYRECDYSLNDTDVIIVTYDGKGMCASIQQAIEMHSNYQTIILVDGYYKKSASDVLTFCYGNTTFRTENLNISAQNIRIRGVGDVSISGPLSVDKSVMEINGVSIRLRKRESDEAGFFTHDSKVIMNKCRFYDTDVESEHNSKVIMNQCRFYDTIVAFDCGEATITDCVFTSSKILIGSSTGLKAHLQVDNTEFILTTANHGVGIGIVQNGFAEIKNCDIHGGTIGVIINISKDLPNPDDGGECHISNCKIHDCQRNVMLMQNGYMRMESCDIFGGGEFGISLEGSVKLDIINCNLRDNLKDIAEKREFGSQGTPIINETNVKRVNNDGFGLALHVAKQSASGIFEALTGKKLF